MWDMWPSLRATIRVARPMIEALGAQRVGAAQ
jgi:hypothetical protein